MNVKEVKEILIDMGFIRDYFQKPPLAIRLKKLSDRNLHYLAWDPENPTVMLIIKEGIATGRIKVITEQDLLLNNNGLSSNAIKDYYRIKEELQSRGLAFEWGWSEL